MVIMLLFGINIDIVNSKIKIGIIVNAVFSIIAAITRLLLDIPLRYKRFMITYDLENSIILISIIAPTEITRIKNKADKP